MLSYWLRGLPLLAVGSAMIKIIILTMILRDGHYLFGVVLAEETGRDPGLRINWQPCQHDY